MNNLHYLLILLVYKQIGSTKKYCDLPRVTEKIYLKCKYSTSKYVIDDTIQANVQQIALYGFNASCPKAYDYLGMGRQAPHMCTASGKNRICMFYLFQSIITSEGAIISCDSGKTIDFSDPSISGEAPYYYETIHRLWYNYFQETKVLFDKGLSGFSQQLKTLSHKRSPDNEYLTYKLVVPTRMKWDDCFNHLSFQSVPFLGMIYEFHRDVWDEITWHSSLFTAALLRLLDVPLDRIVISKTIHADTLLLPWLPSWCPPQLASIHGIAANVTRIMRNNLLSSGPQQSSRKRNKAATNGKTLDTDHAMNPTRYIVYLARNIQRPRPVVNQGQLLQILQKYLRAEYKIVVVSPTPEYPSIDKLHDSWREHAKIFSKARVVLGPHGGSFNNIIWTPEDCDFIEFNEFPDAPAIENSTDTKHFTVVRSVFLNAFWAKGGSGRFWVLESVRKHPHDFYMSKIFVSPRELLEVFRRIGGILVDVVDFESYPFMARSRWSHAQEAMRVYHKHGSLSGFQMSRSYASEGNEYALS